MTASVTNWLEPGLVRSESIADGDFNLIDRRQRFFVLFMRSAMGRLVLCARQAVRINITSSLRLTVRGLRGRGPRKTLGAAARSGNAQFCNFWFTLGLLYPMCGYDDICLAFFPVL